MAMEVITQRIGGAPAAFEEQVYPCELIWRSSMQKPQPSLQK